jgi:hypothetical protein
LDEQSMPRRRWRGRQGIAGSLGLAIAVCACACARIVPSVPTGARSGDVELRLDHLRTGLSREMVFATRSDAPHVLRRGWLTVPTRDPCTGGADVENVSVDGGAIADGRLPAGSHELAVKFEDRLNDLSLDGVVDLEIDDGACLRTPVISQSIPLTIAPRAVIVGGMGLDGNQEISGLRGIVDFHAGAGGWFGPFLLTAQAGVGFTLCHVNTCGKEGDGSARSGIAVPFTLDARYALGTATSAKLISVALVGARYSFAPVQVRALDGDRDFAVHAVQGVIGWGLNDLIKGRFEHPERALAYEFAVPAGVVFDQGAPSHRVAFAAGLEIRFVFQL